MAEQSTTEESSTYYIPHNGWYPVWTAFGAALMLGGVGFWLNSLKAGEEPNRLLFYIGALVVAVVLFAWFAKVIDENHKGLAGAQLKKSYVWGMGWFIFSEVMFFAAFFGALFYTRTFAVSWIGGEGAKGITGEYLWPEFSGEWPVIANPDPGQFPNPSQSMASPGVSNWLSYLPFWNTVILLSSSVTVHFAHTAMKNAKRAGFNVWLGVTVLLGVLFLILQAEEIPPCVQRLGADAGLGHLWLDVFYSHRLPRFSRHVGYLHSVCPIPARAEGTLRG